jgi:hypothetical protein
MPPASASAHSPCAEKNCGRRSESGFRVLRSTFYVLGSGFRVLGSGSAFYVLGSGFCLLSPVSCLLPPASCLLPPASCLCLLSPTPLRRSPRGRKPRKPATRATINSPRRKPWVASQTKNLRARKPGDAWQSRRPASRRRQSDGARRSRLIGLGEIATPIPEIDAPEAAASLRESPRPDQLEASVPL